MPTSRRAENQQARPRTSPTITDKDRIEALFKLAEAAWREFDKRRSYEWKVNFGLWAGLATIAGFAAKENLRLGDWLWVIFFIIGLVYIFIWTRGLYQRNKCDQVKAKVYWELIRDNLMLEIPNELRSPPPATGDSFLTNWSHLPQIVITLFFLALTGVVLTSEPKPPDTKFQNQSTRADSVIAR